MDGVSSNISVVKKKAGAVRQLESFRGQTGILIVRSLALHEPTIPVYLDTLNLHPGETLELERAHSEIIVTNAATPGAVTRRNEMACRKPFVFLRAMDDHPHENWYGLFDADLLVAKALARSLGHPA